MNSTPATLGEAFLTQLYRGQFETDPDTLPASAAEHEQRTLRLSHRYTEAQLLGAARRLRSTWALEALVARVSHGSLDWVSLRSELVAHGARPRTYEPALDKLSLEGLWLVARAAMYVTGDLETTRAAAAFLAHRGLAGGDFPSDQREPLAAMLLRTDQHRLARRYGRTILTESWVGTVLGAELEHPRFGGSFEGVLAVVSQAYRRVGLESITFNSGPGNAWEQLGSVSARSAQQAPLVSIVMLASSPGPNMIAAVRSIASQSYSNWELLLVDAGSSDDGGAFFEKASALDDRVRLIGRGRAGDATAALDQVVRDHARGEIVVSHSERSWSHPRRIELQVNDLLNQPTAAGNVVRGAWVSDDLSFVQGESVGAFSDETSLMILRESATSATSVESRLLSVEVPLVWTLVPEPSGEPLLLPPPVSVDLLIVDDFFRSSGGATFVDRVAEEIAGAVADGIRVGVLQRDVIAEARGLYRSERLDQLLAEGTVVWLGVDQSVEADLVVVRHANVAQAYAAAASPVTAERVVVVEDPSSGDARTTTFARSEVTRTVSDWFGQPAAWLRVAPHVASPPRARNAVTTTRSAAVDSSAAPVLSIVMPVYNVAPFLEAAIVSVLYQEFQDFELIIVDDASTDGSRQIIDMYEALDPRIQVIGLAQNTLGGAGIPSNLGIRSARGKYLGFVDSDDILTRGAFARMVELADRSEAEVVVGGFATFRDDLRIIDPAYDVPRAVKLPRGKTISAVTHPDLLRMSPVPWRKLYRMSFIDEFGIEYPEGDYFYEDNPLHWTVLALAERVVVSDELVSFHRMGREGQTMASTEREKGAYAHHFTTALRAILATEGKRREVLLDAFVERLAAARWVVRQQAHPGAKAMLAKRFATLFDRATAAGARVPAVLKPKLDRYRASYPHCDLTIVIPAHDCAGQIGRTLEPLLAVTGANIDVLIVDDGSTDKTLSVLREYESRNSNVHVFEQRFLGSGRARNSVIPLISGRFTLFVEPGDVVDPQVLTEAIREAERQNADLLFTQERAKGAEVDRIDDAEIWQRLVDAPTSTERQTLTAQLDVHPSNRIIRTEVLQDSNIFFGGAGSFDDMPFHWQSIAVAERISMMPAALVTRKKSLLLSEAERRASVHPDALQEMLRYTEERISSLPSYPELRVQWQLFAGGLAAGSAVPMQAPST